MPQVLGQLGLQVGEQPKKPSRPRTYRLRHGKAVLLDTVGPKMRDAFSGHEVPQMLMYSQGESIVTVEDLLSLNTSGMEPKFELIGSHGEAVPVGGLEAMTDEQIESYLRHRRQPGNDPFRSDAGPITDWQPKSPETMTVDELYRMAADEELDVPQGLSQPELAKAIRKAAGYTDQAAKPQAGLKEQPSSTPVTPNVATKGSKSAGK